MGAVGGGTRGGLGNEGEVATAGVGAVAARGGGGDNNSEGMGGLRLVGLAASRGRFLVEPEVGGEARSKVGEVEVPEEEGGGILGGLLSEGSKVITSFKFLVLSTVFVLSTRVTELIVSQ